jgi:hypothetical protein
MSGWLCLGCGLLWETEEEKSRERYQEKFLAEILLEFLMLLQAFDIMLSDRKSQITNLSPPRLE